MVVNRIIVFIFSIILVIIIISKRRNVILKPFVFRLFIYFFFTRLFFRMLVFAPTTAIALQYIYRNDTEITNQYHKIILTLYLTFKTIEVNLYLLCFIFIDLCKLWTSSIFIWGFFVWGGWSIRSSVFWWPCWRRSVFSISGVGIWPITAISITTISNQMSMY